MQAKALNINCQYVCPGMALTEEFLNVVGTSIDGTLVLSSVPAFLPSVLETAKLDVSMQAFVDSYTAEYNEIPDGFAASAFDAVNIVLDACAKVGTDTPALRAEIAQLREFPATICISTRTKKWSRAFTCSKSRMASLLLLSKA